MMPYPYLIQHHLLSTAKKKSDKTALIIDNRFYAYSQVLTDIETMTDLFKQYGVNRGDRIVIADGNTYLSVIAFWATLFCDAIACPLDAKLPLSVIHAVIDRLAPSALVGYSTLLPENHKQVVCIAALPEKAFAYIKYKHHFQNHESDL